MDKKLAHAGMINSGILTLVFACNTVSALGAGGLTGAILGAIGVFATYLTATETVQFYKARK
jgi:glutamate racemase